MSSLTTFSLNQLVLEVLHVIFYYIDVPDILRVRRASGLSRAILQVSRYLNEATRYRNVWVNAYRTAEFPRPPGPFPLQSVHDLEHILVTSLRVRQNLQRFCNGTTQSEVQMFKLRQIWDARVKLSVNLIFGRFLLVAFNEGIRCYDLNLDESDPNSGGCIIYRTTGRIVRSLHCVSTVDVEGRRFACAVLNEEAQIVTTRILIYSLSAGKQSEMTMDLVYQSPEYRVFDVHSVDLGPRVIVIQGRLGPNLDADRRFIVLDVHAHTELFLPSFTDATWPAAEMPELVEALLWPVCISTSTHLILARSFYISGWSTFFQAFTLPTPHTTFTSTPLSPSHRAIVPGITVNISGTLLHDAVLDASTQDVLVVIRANTFKPSRPHISISQHGILRLSTIHTTRGQGVGTIAFEPLGPFSHPRMLAIHPSFNGTGRVFYPVSDTRTISALEYVIYAHGDNDRCREYSAKVIDYPSLQLTIPPESLVDYDPYSGRICFRGINNMIEIYDFSL